MIMQSMLIFIEYIEYIAIVNKIIFNTFHLIKLLHYAVIYVNDKIIRMNYC